MLIRLRCLDYATLRYFAQGVRALFLILSLTLPREGEGGTA